MPELHRKTPCAQCPFRTTAPKGYLGASAAEDFLDMTLKDTEVPCHMAIDYNLDDWETEQFPTADLCVGSLQFQTNWLKRPRPKKLADACDAVGPNPQIMKSPEEFMERHDNDMNRKLVEMAHKMEPAVRRDYTIIEY